MIPLTETGDAGRKRLRGQRLGDSGFQYAENEIPMGYFGVCPPCS